MGPFQPMNIFLRQEIDRMQRIIALVRHTLVDLKLAIDGTIIMSENLRDALDCMYDARIPARWMKVWFPEYKLTTLNLKLLIIWTFLKFKRHTYGFYVSFLYCVFTVMTKLYVEENGFEYRRMMMQRMKCSI